MTTQNKAIEELIKNIHKAIAELYSQSASERTKQGIAMAKKRKENENKTN